MEPSAADLLSANLARLHAGEEELREKALGMIAADDRLGLHLAVTEAAMDLADILRQFQTADEDLKVVQILGMRTFNAFGASIKLALPDIPDRPIEEPGPDVVPEEAPDVTPVPGEEVPTKMGN